jgi:CRP/FNR family transcriptional regulator, cyclic AMP receptor protein
MSVTPSDLRQVPLFAKITDEHLGQLIDACERRELRQGTVLFEAGAIPDKLLVLYEGEIALSEVGQERFRIRPVSPIGELGALTGIPRVTTAVAATDAKLLSIGTRALMDFFERHGDVAFPFHYNLLGVVADKIRRDRRRSDEMRKNLITTQKAMKRMRDALLEGEDTPLHKQLFEELDRLVEQNKKGHYLVQPAQALPTRIRLDDGSVAAVRAMNKEWIFVDRGDASAPRTGSQWSGVLLLGKDREIPVSGTIDAGSEDAWAVRLDLLINDYAAALDEHLTRLMMLDVVL